MTQSSQLLLILEEMPQRSVWFDITGRFAFINAICNEDDLVEEIIAGNHPYYASAGEMANQWLRKVTATPIAELRDTDNGELVADLMLELLNDVGGLPILQHDQTPNHIAHMQALLAMEEISPEREAPFNEKKMLNLLDSLEDGTRRHNATFSSGWLGKYDDSGDLVIE